MFMLIILVVSAATAALPLLVRLSKPRLPVKLYPANWLLPLLAGLLFFISFYLPDIHLSSETSTFQQHFVGGGIYSALLYLYVKRLLGWRFHWFIDFIMLFAWTSAFGVANKLLEFALLKLHLLSLDTSDAYWDLLANTLGAYCIYFIVAFLPRLLSIKQRRKS